MTSPYEEALDDVHTRFILNLPPSELASPIRIFFQLEQAWWFYDDFLCDEAPAGNTLPRFKHMKPFSQAMFAFSDLLRPMSGNFEKMYSEFSDYKRSISTYGTILLNDDATKVALCRAWKGKSWTFPGGKVNQNESGRDAAARETYEETGFDPMGERGLCGQWREEKRVPLFDNRKEDQSFKLPWDTLRDENKLVYTEENINKRRTCYVCRGVPEDFPFEPVARKEVSNVKFHALTSLPKQTYAVLPFIGDLKKWIKKDNRRRDWGSSEDRLDNNGEEDKRSNSRPGSRTKNQTPDSRRFTPKIKERTGSNPRSSLQKEKNPTSRPKNAKSRSSFNEVQASDPLVESALVSPGQPDRWTEEDMFATNERILGRKITYSGNSHEFAEKGFSIGGGDRMDPHAFRIVGGRFLNSDGNDRSTPVRDSAMQPLVAIPRGFSEDGDLTPFFSNDGKAPWEEDDLLPGLSGASNLPVGPTIQSNSKGLTLLGRLRLGNSANDVEITADEQKEQLCSMLDSASPMLESVSPTVNSDVSDENWEWMKRWVDNIPAAPANELFGDFRFDVDAIMSSMAPHTKLVSGV